MIKPLITIVALLGLSLGVTLGVLMEQQTVALVSAWGLVLASILTWKGSDSR